MPHRLLAASLAVLGISLFSCAGCARGPRLVECPVSPCQGCLTDEEIDQMPILDRPDRPEHPLGNAVRRVYRWQAGEPEPWECPQTPIY